MFLFFSFGPWSNKIIEGFEGLAPRGHFYNYEFNIIIFVITKCVGMGIHMEKLRKPGQQVQSFYASKLEFHKSAFLH